MLVIDGSYTSRKIGAKGIESRNRGQSSNKQTNADFDIVSKASRL